MRRIAITQRVELVPSYGERRDCLDQRWGDWVGELGATAVPLFNLSPGKVPALMNSLKVDLIVLSGGNTLGAADPRAKDAAPERDAFERALLTWALEHQTPVVGVCRGMQMIQSFFGGSLTPVDGHVAVRHELLLEPDFKLLIANEVNSYHQFGIKIEDLAPPLRAVARDRDGFVEAFVHKSQSILGIMWHPEREEMFRKTDIALFQKLLNP